MLRKYLPWFSPTFPPTPFGSTLPFALAIQSLHLIEQCINLRVSFYFRIFHCPFSRAIKRTLKSSQLWLLTNVDCPLWLWLPPALLIKITAAICKESQFGFLFFSIFFFFFFLYCLGSCLAISNFPLDWGPNANCRTAKGRRSSPKARACPDGEKNERKEIHNRTKGKRDSLMIF